MPANSIVRRTDTRMSPAASPPASAGAVENVAVLLDDRARLGTLEEGQEAGGHLVVSTLLQQHGVLPDRLVEVLGHEPARAGLAAGDLGEGDEAELGVAGVDELERLRDVRALDELRL